MDERTQAGPGGAEAQDEDAIASAPPTPDPAVLAAAEAEARAIAADIQRGLLTWLAILVGGSVASALLGHVEGALFFAGAGVLILAQGTDAAAALAPYRDWVYRELPPASARGAVFRGVVRSIVPVAGAIFYGLFGTYALTADAAQAHLAAAWCFGAALVSLALAWRPAADAVMRVLFRGTPGRTRRLTARLVVLALLLPVPGRALFPALMANMRESGAPLADASALTAQLLGEIAIGLAGVGLFVRRNGRETLERLGLVLPRPAHLLVVVVGVAAAFGLNTGMEWIEHHVFPALWNQDTETTRLIAGRMPVMVALLLGVSAGVGEEITLRGALQPRLGIVLTSLVFACAHVQYTWFGMTTVGLLGVLLGTIRQRTNTTTAILVHATYDAIAAMTTGS